MMIGRFWLWFLKRCDKFVIAAVLSLILCVGAAPAQVQQSVAIVKISYPEMPIIKQGLFLWQCQRVVAEVEVKWPDGNTSRLRKVKRGAEEAGEAAIDATLVRGFLRKKVDACSLVGALDSGDKIVLNLPPEPVSLFGTALAIDCEGTITRPTGEVWRLTVFQPSCPTRATWPRPLKNRVAVPVVATGQALFP